MSLSRLARVVFTDSKFSQTELARYLNLPIKKFIVIHLAGDHIKYIHPDPMILKRYGLMKGMYYLIVGSQSLHKNFLTVRNAIKLVKSDIKFVFAGGQFDKVFTKGVIQDERHNIITTGYVTDEELKALYTNALGHIFPSQYEGFGLPLLEAMHCGCPVLCSQAASLPEIAGDAALYFDPANPQDIATAIETMYADKQLRDGFIQKGYQCAGNFNWQATARNTLRVLLTTVGANK
jgi:glycosyltransferase involved in cell wall biosynthesis